MNDPDDLIQRLRATDSRLCRDAAAEIERLRGHITRWSKTPRNWCTADHHRAMIPRAELRDALRPTNDESPQPKPGA